MLILPLILLLGVVTMPLLCFYFGRGYGVRPELSSVFRPSEFLRACDASHHRTGRIARDRAGLLDQKGKQHVLLAWRQRMLSRHPLPRSKRFAVLLTGKESRERRHIPGRLDRRPYHRKTSGRTHARTCIRATSTSPPPEPNKFKIDRRNERTTEGWETH